MIEPSWFPLSIEPEALRHYGGELAIDDHRRVLLSLAESIAASPGWREMASESVLVARPNSPWMATRPSLAVLGCLDDPALAWLQGQAQELSPACGHLCYLSDERVREAALLLAARLREELGEEALSKARYTAIPRGGFVVLGYLAYALGLRSEQFATCDVADDSAESPDSLLIVVDDCALTGARLGELVRSHPRQRLVFAHFFSHPELRQAVVDQEPRVGAVVSAYDLQERLAQLPAGWRRKRLDQLGAGRYWIGLGETLCFPWNEPDRLVWNRTLSRPQTAWHVVPPELCLKNRPAVEEGGVSLYIQEEGPGPLVAAADVLYGEFDGQLVIADTKAGESFVLSGVAADMWRALLQRGTAEAALQGLRERYDVDEGLLRKDLSGLTSQLFEAGLLQEHSSREKPARQGGQKGDTCKNTVHHRIFGLTLASDFPFANQLQPAEGEVGEPDLTLVCRSTAPSGVDWRRAARLYVSPYRISKTVSVCELYRIEDIDVLRFSGVGDFYLDERRIECHRAESASDELIEIRFLGAVLGFWLERRGIPALHGSAVDVGGSLAVFLSSNRGGKTGLAAALLAAGHTLSSDDLLPVQMVGGEYVGHAGYPQMRMWPDEAEHFLGGDGGSGQVHPTYSKRRIDVGQVGLGRFSSGSRPIGCFYLPERRDDVAELVEISDLPADEALAALSEHSFSPRLVAAAELVPARRSFFRQALKRLPVRRLVYRSGFELLARVVAEIEKDLGPRVVPG